MDAVELNYPVDVVAPNLVGSEGFGRDRVTVKEVEACKSTRFSALVSSRASIERCSSLPSEKDVTSSVNTLDSSSRDKAQLAELCQHASQLPIFPGEDVSKQLHCSGSNGLSWIPRPEEVQVQKKAGKASRSSNGCPKRPRIAQLEDKTGPAGVDDTKDLSDKLGSYPKKCDPHEKTQLAKQKNNFGSKRGDRRNLKASMKTKYDSFSVKAGLASFSLAGGGNNFFGLYGLKTDAHDITKLVDDLSLNDLLDGTYECPSLGKDKGKKAANMSENILHSVEKACSILQLPRPVQFQSLAEMDSCSNEIMPTCPSNSVSMAANGDNEESSTTDLSSSNKDSCSKHETPPNLLDFSFDQPKDTLERLALPPPKNLDSLLLDASKPAVSSRNVPDQRPGKQISRRATLPMPPFPWSHNFSGNCRINSDSVKIISRSMCQGRWVRIGNTASFLGAASDCFTNVESLTYDETLVPSHGPKLAVLENNNAPSNSISSCEWGLASSAASLATHIPLESGGDLNCQVKVEHCPRLLAAAQTLYDIATHTSRLNQDGIMRWPKKPAQKAMKARKSKSNEKPEEIFAASTSSMGSDHLVRSHVDQILPSKRLKLSTVENKKDLVHVNGLRKGPINWSTPKSSRSSPNKSIRDSIAEPKHSTAYIVKQSCIMPPAAKVLNRTCNGQQKVRKLMQMDWNRECDRHD